MLQGAAMLSTIKACLQIAVPSPPNASSGPLSDLGERFTSCIVLIAAYLRACLQRTAYLIVTSLQITYVHGIGSTGIRDAKLSSTLNELLICCR